MKKIKSLLFISLVIFSEICFAQTEKKELTTNDPLDLSAQTAQIQKYGVPTFKTVAEMKSKADALYDAQSWKEAALAYEVYAKNVNWLANLVSQCLEPYYSASYDQKKNISYSNLSSFIPYETQANKLKEERNRAYVKMGLCYKNLGDIKNAVIYLYQALDLLSVNDLTYWNMAKDALAEIVQYESEK